MNWKSGSRQLAKSKRIGILGGMSYESTIKYYDLILQKYYEKFNDYHYPEVVIFSLNFQKVIDYEFGDDKAKYIEYLMRGIRALENADVSFILMAANSPHAVFEEIEDISTVPLISIVKSTAQVAQEKEMKKLLLIGIKFTMQSTFYQKYFKKLGMEVITPSNEEQNEIDKIIFNELVIGYFKQQSKKRILQVTNNYKVDGVILGCTELPLILNQRDTEIILLDTVEIHAEAALKYYLSLK
ncbi:MAG: aspartate/glutamate racemase family protein [Candidatus Hodarchaeota archaeon]